MEISNGQPSASDLISELSSTDIETRVRAREQLIHIGKSVVPLVIDALQSRNHYVRWEATKILGKLKDKRAAPVLVNALRDDRHEVQWVAAEGLISLGTVCLPPLLQELGRDIESLPLKQGAHHILHDLERRGILNDELLQVLESLRHIDPDVALAVSVHRALTSLRRHEG